MSISMTQFELVLARMSKTAIPVAVNRTLNTTAFEARKHAQDTVREKMVQRNRFTVQSFRVEQARRFGEPAVMGTVAPYMKDQEFGATQTGKGDGKPIPTSFSAGQARAPSRTRLVRETNKMQSIQLRKGGARFKNKRQQNRVAILQASTKGSKYVYLDMFRRKGIFKVIGRGKSAKVEMVHDLSRKSVTIKPTPTIGPAARLAGSHMSAIYYDALQFQMRRLGAL